ncbi:hypothetical protein F8203_gp120 [Heliothis virescens ascovirus 3f]|uniref:Uncharacterized protein n=1 Tax=Heliothis virescens ascovirus 3f TaxID=328614 RepID=A0A171PVK2_9VIRU|nr:hypothetical protein F8203_gp120 [Heliothis virescens ascovirus 3f]AJP09086.1 hypothetical protein [Heliothis virescens ascovirus 3f]
MEDIRFIFEAHGGVTGPLSLISRCEDYVKLSSNLHVEVPASSADVPVSVSIKVRANSTDTRPMIVDFACGKMECSLVAMNRRRGVTFDGFFDKNQKIPNLLFVDSMANVVRRNNPTGDVLTRLEEQQPLIKITIYDAYVPKRTTRLVADSARSESYDEVDGLHDDLDKAVFFETGQKSSRHYENIECSRDRIVGTFNVTFTISSAASSIKPL